MNKQILTLILLLLLIGCTKPQLICQNITINSTTIEYVYNTTIKEVPSNCTNNTIYLSNTGNSCDITLINQIKMLERTIDKWAIADINITINATNTTNITGDNST